jgi:hypothetical protein
VKLVQILSLAGKGDVNLRVDLRTRTADGALTYDTQEGATILLEVERRLYALVESKQLSAWAAPRAQRTTAHGEQGDRLGR